LKREALDYQAEISTLLQANKVLKSENVATHKKLEVNHVSKLETQEKIAALAAEKEYYSYQKVLQAQTKVASTQEASINSKKI
jgi:hypothetical protein